MRLDSYLEIFTTMYGWAFANIIGEVFTGTGLVALPFAIIVFNQWREAKESAAGGAGIQALIEAITTRLIIAMFVFALCFATTPFTNLATVNLSYTPAPTASDPAPQTASLQGGTGSGYDQAMRDVVDGSMSQTGALTYVPAWWFAVMGLSSGVNAAVRDGVASAGREIRIVEDKARLAAITDPKLMADLQRFYSECFVPARSRYLSMASDNISAAGKAVLAADNKDYGPTDVDWMGGQFYRVEPGFYNEMRSYNPVPGFAVNPARDTDYIGTGDDPTSVNPEWGRPTCTEWWTSAGVGLRSRMVTQSNEMQDLLTKMASLFNWSSQEASQDLLARNLVEKASIRYSEPDRIMGNDQGMGTRLLRGVGGLVSTAGLASMTALSQVVITPLREALPMVQALVLMGIYMFMPLLILFSGYNLKAMMLGGIAIFTVKFWAAMWYIAYWLDAHLIQAMYPGMRGANFFAELLETGDLGQGQKRLILNLLLMMMLVGLPMLWTGMLAWVGVRVGDAVGRMMGDANNLANRAGSESVSKLKR